MRFLLLSSVEVHIRHLLTFLMCLEYLLRNASVERNPNIYSPCAQCTAWVKSKQDEDKFFVSDHVHADRYPAMKNSKKSWEGSSMINY